MKPGLLFDIQRFSVHNGPGIRTTVFLKGCPLRCAWCHNPEGQEAGPEIVLVTERCLGCGACLAACPRGGTEADPGCALCGLCAQACPSEARRLYGRRLSVEELLQEVLKDRIFYDESGGGVTFSGGEPLNQAEFLIAALEGCRARGIHAALDTCGYGEQADLLAAAETADLVLYDLKLMDEEAHRRATGFSNRCILDNLRALAAVHGNIWIRIPVIPGVNDDPGFLHSTTDLIRGLPAIRQVQLLPYHRTGIGKFERLKRPYGLPEADAPRREKLEELASILQRAGIVAAIGG